MSIEDMNNPADRDFFRAYLAGGRGESRIADCDLCGKDVGRKFIFKHFTGLGGVCLHDKCALEVARRFVLDCYLIDRGLALDMENPQYDAAIEWLARK